MVVAVSFGDDVKKRRRMSASICVTFIACFVLFVLGFVSVGGSAHSHESHVHTFDISRVPEELPNILPALLIVP
jgi:hypothetical protein